MPFPIRINLDYFDPQYFTEFSADYDFNRFEVQCKPVVSVKAIAKAVEEAANMAAKISMRRLLKLRCKHLRIPRPDGKAWLFHICVSRDDGKRVVVVAHSAMAYSFERAWWIGSASYRP